MPRRKRLREDSYHDDDDASHSSKVYIIKLVPAASSEHPSTSKNEVTKSDNPESGIKSSSSQNFLHHGENIHSSSSCEFSPTDIKFECDLDNNTQSEDELLVNEESETDSNEFSCELPQGRSEFNYDDDDLSSLDERLVPSEDASRDFNDSLSACNQNSEERSAQESEFANAKKLRGWDASRNKVTFQKKWLKEFPFIEYDAENNVMFCRACRKYVNDWRKTSPFVAGNRNFRESMLRYHERSSMHTECQELANTIASEDAKAFDRDLYKEQLSHVFKSVYFIFKNKMPYTHYIQLCENQKREGTEFSVYTSHVKVVPLFGKFICMAFEKEVAKKLENVTEFSLILDASFRRNIESHDLVYLKYLDDFSVKTVFLGVIDTSAKLHDSVYSILNDLFKKYGVGSWVDKIVYLMTDKSDNHMWLEGFIDLIKNMAPDKFFGSVTYLSHKIKYCASIVQNHKVSSTFDALLWSMYCYYEKIDKSKKNLTFINKELENIVETYGNLPKNSYTTLYYEALIAIEKDYGNFVQLLEAEQLIFLPDAKVRKAGGRILSVITRSCFLCKLALFIDIFSCLNDFSEKLNDEDTLPYDVHLLLDEVCSDIEKAAAAEGPKCKEIGEELAATPCCFRGVAVVEDGSIKHVLPEVKAFAQDLISYLRSLIDDDSFLEKCFIFNVCMWPETEEVIEFGNDEFIEIFKKLNNDVKEFKIENALEEWKTFKTKVISLFPSEIRQNSKYVVLKMASEYENEFPYVAPLLKKILLLNFESSEIKRGYQEMCLNKSFSRSMLSLQSLQISMMVSMYGPSLNQFDFSLALDLFLNSRHRKFRKKIIDKKLLYCDD